MEERKIEISETPWIENLLNNAQPEYKIKLQEFEIKKYSL